MKWMCFHHSLILENLESVAHQYLPPAPLLGVDFYHII